MNVITLTSTRRIDIEHFSTHNPVAGSVNVPKDHVIDRQPEGFVGLRIIDDARDVAATNPPSPRLVDTTNDTVSSDEFAWSSMDSDILERPIHHTSTVNPYVREGLVLGIRRDCICPWNTISTEPRNGVEDWGLVEPMINEGPSNRRVECGKRGLTDGRRQRPWTSPRI